MKKDPFKSGEPLNDNLDKSKPAPDHELFEKQDFRGYEDSEEGRKIISPTNEEEELTADVKHKKEENPESKNPAIRNEMDSDGSANAFEGTEEVARDNKKSGNKSNRQAY